jgi:predicted nucleic acid-binding protein
VTFVYFDASALVKRYVNEPGTAVVNHLFATVPPPQRIVLTVGVGETVSVIVRRRNTGALTVAAAAQAVANFRSEVLDHPDVAKIDTGAAAVGTSLAHIDRHSLNATDALVLVTALDFAAQLRPAGHDLLLITSDRRLTAAAGAEGVAAFATHDSWATFRVGLAGGGVRGGLVHGATDDYGIAVAEERVHVHDFHATILHLLGLDHERLTFRHAGRNYRLTDVSGRVVRAVLA